MSFADQMDRLKDQAWYQQTKASYDQLTPEQQQTVKWGSFVFAVILLVYFALSMITLANTARNDYFEKRELAEQINSASDEMRRLKGQNAGFSQSSTQNWKSVFQNIATAQGLPENAIEVSKEAPGAAQNVIQETLLDVKVTGAQTAQLTKILYSIEHGNPPMRLKGLKIDGGSEDGSLVATLHVSGYLPKPEKAEKSK